MPLNPFDADPVDPAIAAIPKADLHVHQEEVARLDRVIARREGRAPYDYRSSAQKMIHAVPPGVGRINGIYAADEHLALGDVPADAPEYIIAKIVDALVEAAADGAILVELRYGITGLALQRPDFMALFREAERQAQAQYPNLYAEPVVFMNIFDDPAILAAREQQLETCLRMASEGLAGMDLRIDPYDVETPPSLWATAYRWAERIAEAGLGITIHSGEFSSAGLAAAMRMPHLRRIGHATHVADDPRLLDALASRDITIECCLTCNVILGAIASYEDHPIRTLQARGVPVTLATDLPVHTGTTIGREYAVAAKLGFSQQDLLALTRNAIQASFTSPERKAALLQGLHPPQAS